MDPACPTVDLEVIGMAQCHLPYPLTSLFADPGNTAELSGQLVSFGGTSSSAASPAHAFESQYNSASVYLSGVSLNKPLVLL